MATGASGDPHDKIKSLFGAGNRVDPKVWTAWVENLAHSGQSQPMAGHFSEVDHESKRKKEAADKLHMEFITEDYFLQGLQDGTKEPAVNTGKTKQGRPKKIDVYCIHRSRSSNAGRRGNKASPQNGAQL
eukprot:Skav213199  [mRNA]  locus=scaffold2826:354450:360628:- [translate_table: standard]